mmetsp:Transcript_19838/g.64522  ORF Transcript_19838/g.64522 Transcript_19838/m.64522 type:complete len:381 (-) Transcript_19838:273-1415(-)
MADVSDGIGAGGSTLWMARRRHSRAVSVSALASSATMLTALAKSLSLLTRTSTILDRYTFPIRTCAPVLRQLKASLAATAALRSMFSSPAGAAAGDAFGGTRIAAASAAASVSRRRASASSASAASAMWTTRNPAVAAAARTRASNSAGSSPARDPRRHTQRSAAVSVGSSSDSKWSRSIRGSASASASASESPSARHPPPSRASTSSGLAPYVGTCSEASMAARMEARHGPPLKSPPHRYRIWPPRESAVAEASTISASGATCAYVAAYAAQASSKSAAVNECAGGVEDGGSRPTPARSACRSRSVAVPPFMRVEPVTASGPTTGHSGRPLPWHASSAATSENACPQRGTTVLRASARGENPMRMGGANRSGFARQWRS